MRRKTPAKMRQRRNLLLAATLLAWECTLAVAFASGACDVCSRIWQACCICSPRRCSAANAICGKHFTNDYPPMARVKITARQGARKQPTRPRLQCYPQYLPYGLPLELAACLQQFAFDGLRRILEQSPPLLPRHQLLHLFSYSLALPPTSSAAVCEAAAAADTLRLRHEVASWAIQLVSSGFLLALTLRVAFFPCRRASFAAAQLITKRVCGGALWQRKFPMMRARPCAAHTLRIQVRYCRLRKQ